MIVSDDESRIVIISLLLFIFSNDATINDNIEITITSLLFILADNVVANEDTEAATTSPLLLSLIMWLPIMTVEQLL